MLMNKSIAAVNTATHSENLLKWQQMPHSYRLAVLRSERSFELCLSTYFR